MKKILVPVDFSKEAELAIEWAVNLAKEEKDAVIWLLHILPAVPIVEAGLVIERLIEIEWDNAKQHLEQWQRKVPPPLSSSVVIGKGDPLWEIAELCRREDIDLVVMTTHGRRGLSRMAHPNLSERVVRVAPCPVLVLHLNSKTEATVR
jgi:nucleotide-binding universal stress UspA family protein